MRTWTHLALALSVTLSPLPSNAEDPDLLDDSALPPKRTETLAAPDDGAPRIADDRIKSVQRKPFLKRGRLELTPFGSASMNNTFFPRVGVGARLAYHLRESLALGLRYTTFEGTSNDDVRLAKRSLQARVDSAESNAAYGAEICWTPLYGKVALFDDIRHFELYLLGGAGSVSTKTAELRLASHLGVGQRLALNDWFAVGVEVLETLWVDRATTGDRAQLQHDLSLQLGMSLYYPFTFRYREP